MTLKEYCRLLGWSARRLADEAGINHHTANKAVNGKPVTGEIAGKIAAAIGKAMGKTIYPGEIDGLVKE